MLYTLTTILVGVITRVIAMAADAVVLGITLWKTLYLFRVNADARPANNLAKTLAYNGIIRLLDVGHVTNAYSKQVAHNLGMIYISQMPKSFLTSIILEPSSCSIPSW